MERKQIDRLLKNLGMEVEMTPLLESTADGETGYERFESAIIEILENCRGENPVSQVKTRMPKYVWRYGMLIQEGYETVKVKKRVDQNSFPRKVDFFKRNYGVSCESETMREIGASQNLSAGRIAELVRDVEGILRYNKRNLFYQTL